MWNPALLFTFVMGGHNDGLMIFWLLLGYLLLQRRETPTIGILVMGLGALTKLIALLPLSIFAVAAWRRMGEERYRVLVRTVVGGLLIAFLHFLPFGSPSLIVERLAREATAGASFSPVLFAYFGAERMGDPFPAEILPDVSILLFLPLALFIFWLTWKKRPAVRAAADLAVDEDGHRHGVLIERHEPAPSTKPRSPPIARSCLQRQFVRFPHLMDHRTVSSPTSIRACPGSRSGGPRTSSRSPVAGS